MKILLVGGAGSRNSGDEALLRAAVQACRAAAPNARLGYLANNADLAAQSLAGFDVTLYPSPRMAFFHNDAHYGRADEVFRSRWRALHATLVGTDRDQALQAIAFHESLDFIDRDKAAQCLGAIADCDVLVVHGGGILTSATRSRLWEQCLAAEIAAGLGKRIVLRSQQLGPFVNDEDRGKIATLLGLSAYTTTRDLDMSAVEVRRIDHSARVHAQVDDAIILESERYIEDAEFAATGLSAGEYICVGYRHNPGVGVDDGCLALTAQIISLSVRKFCLPVVLLPQGPFDEAGLDRLASCINNEAKMVRPKDLVFGTIAVASRARIMIACPHHSLVFALRGAVPVLSPVKGEYYLHKNIGSMRLFGLEDYVVDLGLPPDILMPAAEKRIEIIYSEYKSLRRKITRRLGALRNAAFLGEQTFKARLHAGQS